MKGGVEKRIHEVSVRLVERGHEVHVYGMRSWDGPAVIERDRVVLHGVCPGEALYAGGRRGIAQALRFGASVLRSLLSSDADMPLGSRLRGEIQPGAMPPLHRYIVNPFLTWFLNRVSAIRISDAHTGLRAFRREALERMNLKTGGMEFASETIIEAAKAGLRIEEVPITYSARVAPSKLDSFSDGWRHVRFMLLYRSIPFITVPGLIFVLFGFFLMVIFLLKGNIETSFIHSFILAAVFFVGGIQALLAGINIAVYSAVLGYGEAG